MRTSWNWQRVLLITLALIAAGFVLVLPLALIFVQAFSAGWRVFVANVMDANMRAAIELTLLAAVISVPVNVCFGVALAWCVTHYDFVGRRLLVTLVDIPYATSPVVAGLCYLVLYSSDGHLGGWLAAHGVRLMFAWPGIVMVTIFVTAPFVARMLVPLMQAQGDEQEQAALSLGASGWHILWRITLPKIKWGLLYGATLTTARAVGEYGAVSVVSGAIMGHTVTLALQVEQLNEDNQVTAAFTAAVLLTSIALMTLGLRTWIERRERQTQ